MSADRFTMADFDRVLRLADRPAVGLRRAVLCARLVARLRLPADPLSGTHHLWYFDPDGNMFPAVPAHVAAAMGCVDAEFYDHVTSWSVRCPVTHPGCRWRGTY